MGGFRDDNSMANEIGLRATSGTYSFPTLPLIKFVLSQLKVLDKRPSTPPLSYNFALNGK